VYDGNGNDSIRIQHLINKEAFLFGEAGKDTIKAGGGRSVLVGGSGDDSLTGGKRRDVLIGGLGRDAITGVVGDDIMIAGTTDHDTNEMALCEILEEWSSGDDYSTRRATLSGSEALPGLLHVSKVHDDGVEDKLEKTYDTDWYFANIEGGGVKDKVVKPNFSLITDI
jgi:Ca2+-binding RTX toxin-like protein